MILGFRKICFALYVILSIAATGVMFRLIDHVNQKPHMESARVGQNSQSFFVDYIYDDQSAAWIRILNNKATLTVTPGQTIDVKKDLADRNHHGTITIKSIHMGYITALVDVQGVYPVYLLCGILGSLGVALVSGIGGVWIYNRTLNL